MTKVSQNVEMALGSSAVIMRRSTFDQKVESQNQGQYVLLLSELPPHTARSRLVSAPAGQARSARQPDGPISP